MRCRWRYLLVILPCPAAGTIRYQCSCRWSTIRMATYAWNNIAEPRFAGQQSREPLSRGTLSIFRSVVYHILCFKSVSVTSKCEDIVGRTLQMHPGFGCSQCKLVKFWPGLRIVLGFSTSCYTYSNKNQQETNALWFMEQDILVQPA